MRFFSKFTVICNCCFLVWVVLRYMEVHKNSQGHEGQIITLSWLESTLVTLGLVAIIINVLFLMICLIFASLKVKFKVPVWMIIFNVLVFCCQIYFHFFLK